MNPLRGEKEYKVGDENLKFVADFTALGNLDMEVEGGIASAIDRLANYRPKLADLFLTLYWCHGAFDAKRHRSKKWFGEKILEDGGLIKWSPIVLELLSDVMSGQKKSDQANEAGVSQLPQDLK